ncbi:hypothetical protein Bca52824_007416 [Brassica carinata]|uniref:Uncharacterized protein n=1 Tax=Brassica carinata TaxID=52824 RepID=A0A8X7W9W0_BRACI|nr:hypothetical protein Bca52824_007416 [Brassica carinata]
MDSSTSPVPRHVSESPGKVESSIHNKMDRTSDLESGSIIELSTPVPGMWRFPTNPNLCCIYRVPDCLREVNPKAYTPQLVLIGPLHRSLKFQALKSRGDITKAKSLGYLNTEAHKKIYLVEFTKRVEGNKVVEELRRKIKEDEDLIRASYSESTAWIGSSDFVEMILHDSIFIIELMLRFLVRGSERIGDPLMDELCLENTIKRDLILLENQLPYFILEKLFDPIIKILYHEETLHITDLFRCIRVETLPDDDVSYHHIDKMHNADKLYSRGVKFEAVEEEFSVWVKFDKHMAFEQSYYPYNAYVCDYVTFLDFLIDTEKDVDLLVEKGIIKNWLGHHGAVSELVNKLCLGVVDDGSSYANIASKVLAHYDNKCNKARSILRRVYFNNMWRGTATIAAACILILTIIQTVTSIIDVIKK